MSGDSASDASAEREPITDRAAQLDSFADRAHEVALDIVGDAELAADVVHEVFDPLRDGHAEGPGPERRDDEPVSPGLTSVLLATRAAALDRRAAHPPPDPPAKPAAAPDDPFATDDQTTDASPTRVELAQAAAVVLGAGDASALDLHLRYGIYAAALAEVLGVTGDEAPERLARLRSRRDDALAAFALWHGGDPECPALAAELDDGTTLGRAPFDVVTFDVVATHRAECAECARIERTRANSAAVVAAHRRASDDTPTALLRAPIDRPGRPAPSRVESRRHDLRRVAIAAALVLVMAGGAIAVSRSTGSGRDETPGTSLAIADGTDDTIEVRSLGPPPLVVATDATTATTTTTTVAPPDATTPEPTTADTIAP